MTTLKSTLRQTKQPPSYDAPDFLAYAPQVIDMFESQYTKNLPDRKANAIIKYSKLRENGFFYEQIQDLTKIIKYAERDLFAGTFQMFQAIHSVLQIGGESFFNKRRSSDQMKYLPLLPGFFNSLEPLLSYEEYTDSEDPQFQKLRYSVINFINRYAYEGIASILKAEQSFQNKKNEGVEISPLQGLMQHGTKNLQALLQTTLIDNLLKLLIKYGDNWEFLYSLINIFSYMMKYKKFAGVLCQKDLLKMVVDVVFLCEDFRTAIVKICLQIIWDAIEGIGVQVVNSLVSHQTIFQLKNLFKTIMAEGYKLEDSYLRNQILILVNYLLSIPDSIPYFLDTTNLMTGDEQLSFFQNLLGCSSIDEETFYNSKNRIGDRKPQFGTTIQDLQFKKLIWSGILTAMQSNYPQVVQLIEKTQFLKYLLLYIDPMANSYAVNRWSDPQLREIQLHCLSILANIVLFMKDHFEQKKGLFCLSKFLAYTSDPDRRLKSLKVFNNASLFEETYKLKIAEEGVIQQLIIFLHQQQENSLQIRELCFSILANLCRDCRPNKKIFREKGGIDIIIRNLKDPNITSSSRYALLAFSILTCLWNAVLGSKRSESLFLDGEGLYVILEFLQDCDKMHRKMGLSCISFLIQNQKTVSFFNEWNSTKSMKSATQLLINIYQQEDERFGVKYENGMIKNKERPLTPQTPELVDTNISVITQKQVSHLLESGGQSYLIRKVKEKVNEYDLRAIVFSILYRTGFSKHGLHAQQQQRIEVIQMYPHFKIGQIWGDINKQLWQQGVKPTTEDEHWMKTSIQQFQQEMSNCINTQALINRQFNKIQEEQLGKFYETIKNSKSK